MNQITWVSPEGQADTPGHPISDNFRCKRPALLLYLGTICYLLIYLELFIEVRKLRSGVDQQAELEAVFSICLPKN